MDQDYTHHAARRRNRSAGSVNHLSLAPLTTRLPLRYEDYDAINAISAPLPHTSYIQGRSAPATPRLLSHSPPPRRPTSRPAPGTRTPRRDLPKTKSASHLDDNNNNNNNNNRSQYPRHSTTTTTTSPAAARRNNHQSSYLEPVTTTDWLLRVGALISAEARESKGQSWLVSRASSTSLGGGGRPAALEDFYALEDADGYSLARERVFGSSASAGASSARASRRGSRDYHGGGAYASAAAASPVQSRFGSRSHSRVGGRMTPAERRAELLARMEDGWVGEGEEDYFGRDAVVEEKPDPAEGIPGPDFVNLDEALEGLHQQEEEDEEDEEDAMIRDEAHIRRLVKEGFLASWFGKMFRVNSRTHAVDENQDGEDDGEEDMEVLMEEERQFQERRSASLKRLQQCTIRFMVDEDRIPPPKEEDGGWSDVAWLMTVAAKALW
ncbi:hypothetical protein C8A00DRAFT_32091 [Chaetomidium leptoderma]|uniref:Uncharacterized protein n=1 Tax=Chaetomidium leptoderma TaxID=669021 RepID=A0AAN6VPD9_9PEZI|nr:hypothetical protein C8A00DRAFT_32091 [Chaetomidium leptoderma]